jgi:hypothetical protein
MTRECTTQFAQRRGAVAIKRVKIAAFQKGEPIVRLDGEKPTGGALAL